MFKRYIIIFSLLLYPILGMTATASAVDLFNDNKTVCESPKVKGLTDNKKPAVCQDKNAGGKNPLFGTSGILTRIISLLTVVVSIVAIISIIYAGFKYVTSGNNPEEVKSARERIIYALIALVIAAMAQIIVRFIVGKVI